jgi:hypothetical protein
LPKRSITTAKERTNDSGNPTEATSLVDFFGAFLATMMQRAIPKRNLIQNW